MNYVGVYQQSANSFVARLTIDGKQRRLGSFATAEEAAKAVDAKAVKLGRKPPNFPIPSVKDSGIVGSVPQPPEHLTEQLDQHHPSGDSLPVVRDIPGGSGASIEGTMKEPSFMQAPPNWEKLHHHPYSSIIPMFEGMDWDAFKSSIRDGYIQRNPIILYREKPKDPWRILNGRHCHAACIDEGITPTFAGLENDDDAARRIAKMDANRRHLNASQRALVIATLTVSLCKEIDKGSPTQSQMAEEAGVSRPVMNDAVKVTTKGTPSLQQAVATKVLSVADAAEIANESPEVQEEEVAKRKKKKGVRSAGKPSANGHVEPKKLTDDNGIAIPERLRPIFEDVPLYGRATAALHKATNALQTLEASESYRVAEKEIKGDKRRYSTSCLTAIHKLKCFRPCLLCDACEPEFEPSEDADPCEKCGGKGYLTGEELEP